MSKNTNPRTVFVRLVLDEIREGKYGEVIGVFVASNGKKQKFPMDDVVKVEHRQSKGAVAKLRPGEFLTDENKLSSRRVIRAFQ